MTKFCRDCKHAKPTGWIFKNYRFAKCSNPKLHNLRSEGLVTGAPKDIYYYCVAMRGVWGGCGREGELWEAK